MVQSKNNKYFLNPHKGPILRPRSKGYVVKLREETNRLALERPEAKFPWYCDIFQYMIACKNKAHHSWKRKEFAEYETLQLAVHLMVEY